MGDLVLITGATGFIGFRVLLEALEQGYNVRAAVRSEAKATKLKENKALKATGKASHVSFITVPDFLVPGAFDLAVKDVKYIIHVASPLGGFDPEDGDYKKHYVHTAVQATLGMFEAAKQSATVKRIVVTSSMIALTPPQLFQGPMDVVTSSESRNPDLNIELKDSMTAYVASKIAAFNASEAWMRKEKPTFDLINIHPAFVLGRDELCESTQAFWSGTNSLVTSVALGVQGHPLFPKAIDQFTSVKDVAYAHVASLEPKVEGNQNFVLSSPGQETGMEWNQTNDTVKKHFPEAVEKGILAANGSTPTIPTNVDNRKTEETFGFKHASFEDCVIDVVKNWLELYENESQKN